MISFKNLIFVICILIASSIVNAENHDTEQNIVEKAKSLLDSPINICNEGERVLWAKKVKKSNSNEFWDIEGLDSCGQLKVKRNLIKQKWNRWE